MSSGEAGSGGERRELTSRLFSVLAAVGERGPLKTMMDSPRKLRRMCATVAMLVLVISSAVALGATPKNGHYSGKSAQRKTISFTVTAGGKKLSHLKIGYKATCRGRGVKGSLDVSGEEIGGTYRINRGRFTVSAEGGTVKGTFISSRKASGTLRLRPTSHGGIFGPPLPCYTGNVKWTARGR